ncbi:MAG: hypothetical protein KC421_16145 [Anaerolineales bacterium]|nr:hypothetical protein [Anaerolineales bacterium]
MNEEVPGYKLLLTYEVKSEIAQEYRQFLLGRYVPSMNNLGLQMSEAWHTAYGDAPNRLIGFVCRDRDTIYDLLDNQTWLELNERLQEFVTDFSYKVVPYRGIFQI